MRIQIRFPNAQRKGILAFCAFFLLATGCLLLGYLPVLSGHRAIYHWYRRDLAVSFAFF